MLFGNKTDNASRVKRNKFRDDLVIDMVKPFRTWELKAEAPKLLFTYLMISYLFNYRDDIHSIWSGNFLKELFMELRKIDDIPDKYSDIISIQDIEEGNLCAICEDEFPRAVIHMAISRAFGDKARRKIK